jgi:hypothetical protein
MDITDIKKTVFLLLPGFLNAPFIIFFIYIWQHRFTLKFAMYRSLLCITVQYNKMVAVITVAYYYHIQNIFCTMLPLL